MANDSTVFRSGRAAAEDSIDYTERAAFSLCCERWTKLLRTTGARKKQQRTAEQKRKIVA